MEATPPFHLSEQVSGQEQAQANAVALLLHHPSLMQVDPVPSARILATIASIDVSDLMLAILQDGDAWAAREAIVDGDGKPVVDPKTGAALYTLLLSPDVASALAGPLRTLLTAVAGDPRLEGWAWTSQSGVLSSPLAAADAPFVAAGLAPRYGLAVAATGGDSESLTLECANHGSRAVALFAQFLDSGGAPFAPPGWKDRLPAELAAVFEPDPAKRFVAVVPPARWPGAQPNVGAAPGALVTLPLADGAHAVRLLLAGPGTGPYDAASCPIGIAASFAVFDAVACAATVAGAAPSTAALERFLTEPEGLLAALPAFEPLAGGALAAAIAAAGDMSPALDALRRSLGTIVFGSSVAAAIDAALGAGSAAASALDLGVVLQVAAAGAAPSPPVAGASWEPFVVDVQLDRAADAGVRVAPVAWAGSFPPAATSLRGTATPAGGGTPRTFEMAIDPINGGAAVVPGSLPSRAVELRATLSDGGGATVASGASGAQPASQAAVVVAPAGAASAWSGRFQHQKKLAYDAAGGGHLWSAAAAPTETVTWQSPDPKHSISNFVDITYAQAPAMAGYAYEAVGIGDDSGSARYTVQNVAGFGPPEAAYRAPASGWGAQARIVYELGGPAAGDGLNFLLSQGTGGYHLRRLRLDSKLSFDPPDSTSWGCFQTAPDGLVVHPAGCVAGVSYDSGVLSVLWLPDAASSEADAPRARVAGGPGSRPGLLSGPRALAVGALGELLVLEALAGRVQALDLWANPVERFGGTPYMALVDAPGTAQLLDLASGPDGSLHVLSYTGDGSDPAGYHLDVFSADGTHVGRTGGVAAAKIAVTLTGDVLALDYEQILGPRDRTEPALSLWTRAS